MTDLLSFRFEEINIDSLAEAEGRVAVFATSEGKLDASGRRVNRLTKGMLARFLESEAFEKAKQGDVSSLAWPAGMTARAVDVVKLDRRAALDDARKAGAGLAQVKGTAPLTLSLDTIQRSDEVLLGLAARAYDFLAHKSDKGEAPGGVTVQSKQPEDMKQSAASALALVEGMFFTRDLTNEPANVLTTTEFADRLAAMKDLGLQVEVLEEDKLKKLGMGSLLSVGQGSISPSKVVVMKWMGGKKGDAPLALVGKGVVFDTGGISLKPAGGMEDMTMDMGGAGVVAGVMRSLALRKAEANVVGLVGLVENMPSDRATRPGDVVTSMKGDTIEVINTDAEGRLVLADVLWYAQETFKPAAIVDLATLTGAIIIGLGHENAGVFSNDDTFATKFLRAAEKEGEGAWRMPLGKAYDALLKSRIADVKNVGGRAAGSITAAQFLQRFIKDDTPWIHLDIAGVASVKTDTKLAPKGATGWGVLALNRLVADQYETE